MTRTFKIGSCKQKKMQNPVLYANTVRDVITYVLENLYIQTDVQTVQNLHDSHFLPKSLYLCASNLDKLAHSQANLHIQEI